MTLDGPLLRILACPLDKGPLYPLGDSALYNPRMRRRYPVVDGIPQLLPSSGEQVPEDEHEELVRRLDGLPAEAPEAPTAPEAPEAAEAAEAAEASGPSAPEGTGP